MIKALADAIDKVQTLPPDRQADAADALERIAKAARMIHVLTPHERSLLDEGLADLDAGKIVSEAEMDAFWSRHKR
jgi:predicted transcriptional regulator